MNHSQFIQVKSYEGELLFSQKRNGLKCTITTKELIFQQPHTTYHMLFKNVIGLVPIYFPSPRSTVQTIGHTVIKTYFPSTYYKLSTRHVHVINRNGLHERMNTHLIVPLNRRFIEKLAEFGHLTALNV